MHLLLERNLRDRLAAARLLFLNLLSLSLPALEAAIRIEQECRVVLKQLVLVVSKYLIGRDVISLKLLLLFLQKCENLVHSLLPAQALRVL